jgi:hypothetical protein
MSQGEGRRVGKRLLLSRVIKDWNSGFHFKPVSTIYIYYNTINTSTITIIA